MPRAPAFKIDAIADLLRQLEYAPAETRKRQMDAAERLVHEVDVDVAYPSAFVIYRITGYRTDGDELVTFSGTALRPDLVNLVQKLSDALSLPERRDGHVALTLEEVASRLTVSAKTIQRYRRDGLVCHFVMRPDGEKHLACYADALQRFMATRPEHLKKAARFTRIGDDAEALIIDEAKRLRATQRLSLNAAALKIAKERGRAHETIRQMLQKHDRTVGEPIFRERGPLTERESQVIHRAWLRGVDLGALSLHFGRSRASMHRVITRRRAQALRTLRPAFVSLPTFELEGAAAVILSPAVVSSDLLALPPHDDALRLLDWSSVAESMDERTEDALLAGWNFLKMRAARGIAGLKRARAAGSDEVDVIETDLRWASLLHRRLALAAFPAALRRIEFNLGRGLMTQPSDQVVTLITTAAGVIRETLEGLDPSRGQRLDRVIAFAMERELAARGGLGGAAGGQRAAARHSAGSIPLGRAFLALDEWESWLDPWRAMSERLGGVPEASRHALMWRYGWDGRPPHTLTAIAQRMNAPLPKTARLMQKAIRELRAAWRSAA